MDECTAAAFHEPDATFFHSFRGLFDIVDRHGDHVEPLAISGEALADGLVIIERFGQFDMSAVTHQEKGLVDPEGFADRPALQFETHGLVGLHGLVQVFDGDDEFTDRFHV